jgi:tetratricopeptide (TPR) repeat protein
MGNTWAIASSLNILSMAVYAQGAYGEVQHLSQEALAHSQTLEDRFNIASSLTGLGQVSQALGDNADGQRFFEDSVRIWREIDDQGSLAQTLNQFGTTLLAREDLSGARRCFLEALEVAKEAQIAPVMVDALLGMAMLYTRKGDVGSTLDLVLHVLQNQACTRNTRDRAEQLRGDLVAQLPAEELTAITVRAQGKTLDGLAQERRCLVVRSPAKLVVDHQEVLQPHLPQDIDGRQGTEAFCGRFGVQGGEQPPTTSAPAD